MKIHLASMDAAVERAQGTSATTPAKSNLVGSRALTIVRRVVDAIADRRFIHVRMIH